MFERAQKRPLASIVSEDLDQSLKLAIKTNTKSADSRDGERKNFDKIAVTIVSNYALVAIKELKSSTAESIYLIQAASWR